jgi:hypothetical protein
MNNTDDLAFLFQKTYELSKSIKNNKNRFSRNMAVFRRKQNFKKL